MSSCSQQASTGSDPKESSDRVENLERQDTFVLASNFSSPAPAKANECSSTKSLPDDSNEVSSLSQSTIRSPPSIVSTLPSKRNATDMMMAASASLSSTKRTLFSTNSLDDTSTALSADKDDLDAQESNVVSTTECGNNDVTATNDLMETFEKTGESSKRFNNYDKPHPKTAEKYKLVKRQNSISKVWRYFHVFESNLPGECPKRIENFSGIFACCNDCGAIISNKNNNPRKGSNRIASSSTSGLNRHLGTHHQLTRFDIERGVGSGEESMLNGTLLSCFNKSKEPKYTSQEHKNAVIKQYTAEWIAKELLPFTIVESPSYRKLIEAHNSRARILTAEAMKHEMMHMERVIREYLVEHLKKCNAWVSITIDHWTSNQKQNYTGEFIFVSK